MNKAIMDNKLLDFIKELKTAFISSVDEDGFPNTKAMLAPRKIEGNEFYFTTNTHSMRVKQYRNNDKACIYFYKRGRYSYIGVMLVGYMEVVTDQQVKENIWRDGDTMYYKEGVTDPDYCVLKFTAQRCRYYRDFNTSWIDI